MNERLHVRILDTENEDEMVVRVSKLLTDSSEDFKESRGGHVPDVFVDTIIHRLYTSVESVKYTFAKSGLRIIMVDRTTGELIGTILLAKLPNHILVQDSNNINVALSTNSAIAPPNHHHAFNLAVNKRYRNQGMAKTLISQVTESYRIHFSGDGLWLRAEPPMHDQIIKLGFIHQPQYDQFFEAGVTLPKDISSVWEFNKIYACYCPSEVRRNTLMKMRKYKYGVFTYKF